MTDPLTIALVAGLVVGLCLATLVWTFWEDE